MRTQIIHEDRLIALWDAPDQIRTHDTVLVNSVPWTVCSTSYCPPGTDPEHQDLYVKNSLGWVDGWIPRVSHMAAWPLEVIS